VHSLVDVANDLNTELGSATNKTDCFNLRTQHILTGKYL